MTAVGTRIPVEIINVAHSVYMDENHPLMEGARLSVFYDFSKVNKLQTPKLPDNPCQANAMIRPLPNLIPQLGPERKRPIA